MSIQGCRTESSTLTWLREELGADNRLWYSVRFFHPVLGGPLYYGPFPSRERAEAFYHEAKHPLLTAEFEQVRILCSRMVEESID